MPTFWMRAWHWWISDSGRSLLVWLGWFGCTLSLVGFVSRFGCNIPSWEEWYSVAELLGELPPVPWVFNRLQEHRYIFGRALHLVIFQIFNHDFRAAMYGSVVLMSAATAVLLRTARQLRGRAHYGDLLIPLLLLNPGASENLFLGYQIAFALDLFFAALLMHLAATSDGRSSGKTAMMAGLLLVALSLGGWIGLAFVPPVTVWIVWLAWSQVQHTRRWLASLGVLMLPGVCCIYFAWNYIELHEHPLQGLPPNDAATTLRVWLEFLSNVFGTWATRLGVAGTTLAGAFTLAVVLLLLRSTVFNRPQRASALGLLAVIVAVMLMGYGVASRRPGGHAPRNIPFVELLGIVGYFTLGRVAWRRFGSSPLKPVPYAASLLLACIGAVMAVDGWIAGSAQSSMYREWHRQYDRDRLAGMPLDFLASKHQLFPYPELRDKLRLLRTAQHPCAIGIPDSPAFHLVSLPISTPISPIFNDHPLSKQMIGSPQVWMFTLSEPTPLLGVRVKFRYAQTSIRMPTAVTWKTSDGSFHSCVCYPWLIDFIWELDFWIDDRTDTLWLQTLHERDVIQVIEVKALVREQP